MNIPNKSLKLDLVGQIARFRNTESSFSKRYLSASVLLIAGLFFIADIYIDYFVEGLPISHVFLEAGVFLAITVALAFEIKQGVDLSHSVSVTQASIDRLKKQLHEVINDEFIRWKLSSSEKEIALFLIKGLSMKEIADLRSVKEKSVRQQSTGIYQKSGVANRNELVAYFIEDMLPLGAS